MNLRLRAAAIILFIRAGLVIVLGVMFLVAGVYVFSNLHGGILAGGVFLVGVFLLGIGLAAFAISIPSLAFGILILTRKSWAIMTVLVGESLLALMLVVATIWTLLQMTWLLNLTEILVAAALMAAVIAVAGGPVIGILLSTLRTRPPAVPR
jgi:hypothetical protein